MWRKVVRWRFFIVVTLTGSLLWFISSTSFKQVEMKQEVNIINNIDQVYSQFMHITQFMYRDAPTIRTTVY
jgi:hypothetical protein